MAPSKRMSCLIERRGRSHFSFAVNTLCWEGVHQLQPNPKSVAKKGKKEKKGCYHCIVSLFRCGEATAVWIWCIDPMEVGCIDGTIQ